jgi:hypothetical protein
MVVVKRWKEDFGEVEETRKREQKCYGEAKRLGAGAIASCQCGQVTSREDALNRIA